MKIFIDKDFKCHLENGDGLTEVETAFFDNKCQTFIEGYRFVPHGESWTDVDGKTIRGETVFPWRDYILLKEFQEQYELMLYRQADMIAALEVLGVAEEDNA